MMMNLKLRCRADIYNSGFGSGSLLLALAGIIESLSSLVAKTSSSRVIWLFVLNPFLGLLMFIVLRNPLLCTHVKREF